MKRQTEPKRLKWILRIALWLALALAVAALGWCRWVYVQIERYARLDQVAQAAPADAIVVFGAAEYDGRPSPVWTTASRSTITASLRCSSPWAETVATSTTKARWAAST
jgi:uncharacterized SAM-binding protein YcdF (DUF218 family)